MPHLIVVAAAADVVVGAVVVVVVVDGAAALVRVECLSGPLTEARWSSQRSEAVVIGLAVAPVSEPASDAYSQDIAEFVHEAPVHVTSRDAGASANAEPWGAGRQAQRPWHVDEGGVTWQATWTGTE